MTKMTKMTNDDDIINNEKQDLPTAQNSYSHVSIK